MALDFGIKTISRINFFVVSCCSEKIAVRGSVRHLVGFQRRRGMFPSVELTLHWAPGWQMLPGLLCCAAGELLGGIGVRV